MAHLPRGFRLSGVACGLKTDPTKLDLALVASDRACTAAGLYTTNQVVAAPVELDRQRTPSTTIRAVVINSGNANACTGAEGLRAAESMTELVGRQLACSGEDVLVMSTGIIGHRLDMAKIRQGISSAAETLSGDPAVCERFARALMTTDTVPKLASRQLVSQGRTITLTGFAKGAGMIAPGMATMLGLIITDAILEPETAADLLRGAADVSFHAITVDGHTSTNDTLLLLANGAAGAAVVGLEEQERLQSALTSLCTELAQAIVRDGEGASHFVEIRVSGATSDESARAMARAIADSPLVKTALAGNDPNWGRIVSAAGYAGVPFDPRQTALRMNGVLLFQAGEPADFDPAEVSTSLRDQRDVVLDWSVGTGSGTAVVWTCDLTAEYVRINADYHT